MCAHAHTYTHMCICMCICADVRVMWPRHVTCLDGYSSTVQGLLDWFEVDLGFTKLWFIQIDLCVMCLFNLYSPPSLSSCLFKDILHCFPRAVGVPLESALNVVSRMSPCGAHDTHACCARSNDHLLYLRNNARNKWKVRHIVYTWKLPICQSYTYEK